jgi:hypothetical protein
MNSEQEAKLRKWYDAFKLTNEKSGKKITRKDLNATSVIRDRVQDYTSVFKYLDGDHDKPIISETRNVLETFERRWIITEEGFLRKKADTSEPNPSGDNGIRFYQNYRTAKIGEAVLAAGAAEPIRIINTYLPNYMTNAQADRNDPDLLRNWLIKGKKVKVLILNPSKHAMRLRAKSLDISGQQLASNLIGDLDQLLRMQEQYKDLLEVKLMDEIPGVSAVILPNKVYYGLHLAHGHTEAMPYTEMPDGTACETYQNIVLHFDTIWESQHRSEILANDSFQKVERALHGVRITLDYLTNHDGYWDLYLHDVSAVIGSINTAPFKEVVNRILRWELQITPPENGIYLKGHLSVLGTEATFDPVNVVTERIIDRDYVYLRFSDFYGLSIHLTFHCRIENIEEPLIGYYTIMSGSDSCSGYLILYKRVRKESLPRSVENLAPYYRRLLSLRDGSYLSLERVRHTRRLFKEKMYFAGTYKVYSYGGIRGGRKGIKVNWLHIDDAGIARYRNQRFVKGDELVGRATYIEPNLHIMSTYFKDGFPERRGYLIAKVAKNFPQKGRFYGAVNLGVSFESDQIPNGKRFILEYVEGVDFDDVEPGFIPIHSKEYKQLPAPIRGLLSGRIKNLNGFLRNSGLITDMKDLESEWEKSIQLGLVFLDSAIEHYRRQDYRGSIVMLERAVNHGFDNLPHFEQIVESIDKAGIQMIRQDKIYKEIQSILSQDPESFDPNI